MDGLFKEWANFMSQYFKIDTTRSNRLDACFKNMDEMRDTIREIKSTIIRKIEECVVDVKKEMKDYVKDRLREKETDHE
jgi:soluble cytochrome b562